VIFHLRRSDTLRQTIQVPRSFARARLVSTGNQNSFKSLFASFALLIAVIPFAAAQAPLASNPIAGSIAAGTRLDIPDSPGFLFSSSSSSVPPDSASVVSSPKVIFKHSPRLQMVVWQGEIADRMTVHDKVAAGLKNLTSSATGSLAAAGWAQLTDGSPNYGTDSGAFGQRLGASAMRGISDSLFSHSVFAPIFHEDPRYYVMGSDHPLLKRLVYAGTRVLITRTDSGHSTPNFAFIAGNAVGSALTVTYYPARNTTFSGVAGTFAGSVGGSALGFVVDEFTVDALVILHHKKKGQQP
jgi:hypothetical protein